jgi:16S rRNA (cytosine967-C5)-methyltransferase
MKRPPLRRLTPRKIAWRALLEFQKARANPDDTLDRLISQGIEGRDRALAWEIAKGAIKYLRKLDHIAQTYVTAPLKSQKPGVLAALRIGLYQLSEMSGIPPFAAVDETVSILSETKMKRDAGFVNAVLRAYLREPNRVKFPDKEKEPAKFLGVFHSYPDWLVNRWLGRFGFEETERMLIANNQRPPTFFRVIESLADRDQVIEQLKIEGVDSKPTAYFSQYLIPDQIHALVNSRPFREGKLIAQDESQGLPVELLAPPVGSTVLDLCSAPGGKTVSLADRVGPIGRIISVDHDCERLEFVRANVARIGFGNVEYVCEDAFKFAPAEKFKYILLDVPCSGLGTMWHNADLRWTKGEGDIKFLSKLQAKLLERAAALLNDNGRLVYSTCTTEQDEIENVVKRFLNQNSNFAVGRSGDEKLAPFEARDGFYHTWPHRHGIGGGGFALIEKTR